MVSLSIGQVEDSREEENRGAGQIRRQQIGRRRKVIQNGCERIDGAGGERHDQERVLQP